MSSAAAATTSLPGEESFLGSFSSFVTSLFPVAHAEEEESSEGDESSGESEESGDDAEGGEGDDAEEEDEEDEPEDIYPEIYEQCENSKPCQPAKRHFEECQKRVQEGKGFKGEDCVEEFFHLAHCAQECTAPKLFSKLV